MQKRRTDKKDRTPAPSEQPWYETCDLYDFVGSCEATMTEAEKREYRNYLRDLDAGA